METNHFQLPPPYTWTITTSICHRATHVSSEPHPTVTTKQTRGNQSHPIAMATYVGTKHIQLSPPYTWAPATSNCYRQTRGPQPHTNCHSHTRRHKPHPTAITKLVGTNHIPIAMATHLDIKHIQLPQPQWREPTTSNCHHQTRGYQSHPIAMDPHLGTNHTQIPQPNTWLPNHIQLTWPHTWAPNTFNCYRQTRGHKPHPTGITKLVATNHTQMPQPHTLAQTTSNCHHQTRG